MNKFLPLFFILSVAMSAKALPTNVSGHITANTTWNIGGSPYTITGEIIVDQNITLTIKPGVTIQMPNTGGDGASIYVDGTLKAVGTVDSAINITNISSFGLGQTKRVVISTLSTNSILQYVTINGLGYYYRSDYTAALLLQSPTCQVKNCSIINTNGTAIELDNASIVSNNTITGYTNMAVYTSIDNLSKLSNNGTGLYVGLSGQVLVKTQRFLHFILTACWQKW